MSRGSSTTQTTWVSRRPSAQMEHSPPSATLKQRSQNDTRSFTSVMARASRLASSFDSFSRWKAMRWADLGPTPGRRPSSSMRSWTGPAYTGLLAAEQAAQAAELAHGRLLELQHLGGGVVEGGQHQVLEHLDVVGVDGVGTDGDRLELAGAVHGDLHRAAARRPLDHLFGRLGLAGDQLLLHLLGLGQELVEVDAAFHGHGPEATGRPPRPRGTPRRCGRPRCGR